MKRISWLDSLASAVGSDAHLTGEARRELARIDEILFTAWNLGNNIILVWTKDGASLRFLAVRHYQILEPFEAGAAGAGPTADPNELITRVLAGHKFVQAPDFDRLRAAIGHAGQLIEVRLQDEAFVAQCLPLVSGLVTRYGVTLVRQRAVLLFDMVGFSLRSPLEQVAMVNSLSYSVNSAYSQLAGDDITLNFARTTTGDGFYIWNRATSVEANITLFKLMMLVLADNAVARSKAKRFPVPTLRAAFHVGEHYEFYQVEALNPTTYAYIVGQVTIELACMLEKALPGQILLGDFDMDITESGTGSVITCGTADFIERTAGVLDQLDGLAVAGEHVAQIRCYLTGAPEPGGGYRIERYAIRDKHGVVRPAYNSKINIHLRHGEPVYLGVQRADLNRPEAPWPG